MKKFIFIFAALFLGLSQVSAQEIYVDNFTAPENGIQKFEVKYRGIEGKTIQGYIFKFEFPEGLSLVTNEDEEAIFEYGDGNTKFDVKTTATGVQASPSSKTSQLSGSDGTLLKLTLKVNAPLVEGNTATVRVYDASLTEKVVNDNGTSSYVDLNTEAFTFTVTIVENRIELDENATEIPDVSGTQNVLVKRTIKAGKGKDNWGTICLPFAMTGEQVKAAFGDDVEFADFTGYTASYDDDDFVTSIEVSFASVDISTGIAANHPYIINLGKDATEDISEFRVDNVNIAFEEEPMIHFGTSRKYKDFVGTYTVINNLGSTAEPCLFLSGNKFYYATGKTKMKAYRAYFAFYEYLKEFDPEAGGAKISFSVDGDATSIDGIGTQRIVEGVYDLSGRKIQLQDGDLNKLQKGVYIIDGKKVTIK